MKYDVIVVGGGPAGIFAAISAKHSGAKVILIEKNQSLGRKLLMSGGGRCNLTNTAPIQKIIENIPGNGKFLYSGLNQFSNLDLQDFFENVLNIRLKEEELGKVFPSSDNSRTVVEGLTKYLQAIKVEILYGEAVQELQIEDGRISGVQLAGKQIIRGSAVVLATGGLSYQHTGSTGDGYRLAVEAGHSLIQPFPTSVPLVSNDKIIKNKLLQGISLMDSELSLYDHQGKFLKAEKGDLIFTHFGISGPAALRISRYVSLALSKNADQNLQLRIDLFPELSTEQLFTKVMEQLERHPQKYVLNGLEGLLPERVLNTLAEEQSTIKSTKTIEVSKKELRSLVNRMKGLTMAIEGTRPLNEAVVTGGGINTKEIEPKSFSSKLLEGLYIVGELLDIDGYTGGYNLQAAFTTGYVAGKAAAETGIYTAIEHR